MTRSAVHQLVCHPASPAPAIRRVEVALAAGGDGSLSLLFAIDAAAGALILPPAGGESIVPTDGLWQHTCCEAFLGRDNSSAYREFNFSPSGQWATYAFADTRQRDRAAEGEWRTRPAISCSIMPGGFALRATLPASQLPPGDGALRVGLAVVLESSGADGAPGCSYWALNHPSLQPDFHHRAAFALTLDLAVRP